MYDFKTTILSRFDQLILELEDLLSTMPDQDFDIVMSMRAYEETSKDQKDNFYRIRSRYLELLTAIPSNDAKLKVTIEHTRSIDPLEFNMKRMLSGMQELRSDYQAGILDAAKSPGNPSQVIEQILREALYETEHFQAPYPKSEIDRLEQIIKRAIRMAFSEDSSHNKAVHQIFHPIIIASGGGKNESANERLHVQYWTRNQERLVSILQILPDEFKLNKLKEQEAKTPREATDDSIVKQKQGFLNDARATIIAAVIGGMFTLIATLIGYLLLTSSAQSSNPQTNTPSPTLQVATQTPLSTIPFPTLTP